MTPDYADLIGTPFVIGGRPNNQSEKNGLDCYGLVVEMSRRFGTTLPFRQAAEDHSLVAKMIELQMRDWERSCPTPGSIILFSIRKRLCHVGIQLNDYEFIHTWELSGGVGVERLDDWKHRIEGHYRYVGK